MAAVFSSGILSALITRWQYRCTYKHCSNNVYEYSIHINGYGFACLNSFISFLFCRKETADSVDFRNVVVCCVSFAGFLSVFVFT